MEPEHRKLLGDEKQRMEDSELALELPAETS